MNETPSLLELVSLLKLVSLLEPASFLELITRLSPRSAFSTVSVCQRMAYLPLEPGSEPVVYANLELRPAEYQALVDGHRIGLTMREFQVLQVLVQENDRVVRREEIYHRVWGGEMRHRERAVDVFVRKVRNKLAVVAPGWGYIHTHFGIGYRFAPEAPDESAESVEAS